MASLALGLLGGYLFGPVGYLVGSFLGNLLDPPKQQGPRLKDLHLQASKYGEMLPQVWGTARLAGNVIWQTDLTEHASTSGGKGGPQVTTYTYSASFAVALCAGPIAGVKRIWADGRVIYGSDSSDNSNVPMTLYLGSSTQSADPTMQAALGATNVPGFRDTAYAVFANWDLSQFYNRIPNLEFEVYTAAGNIPIRISTFSPANPTPGNGGPFSSIWDPQTSLITTNVYSQNNVGGTYFQQQQFTMDGTLVATTIPEQLLPGTTYGFVAAVSGTNFAAVPVPGGMTWYADNQPLASITAGSPLSPSFLQDGYIYTMGSTLMAVLRYPLITIDGVQQPAQAYDASYGLSFQCQLGQSNVGKVYAYGKDPVSGLAALYEFDESLNLLYTWNNAQLLAILSPSQVGSTFVRYGNIFAFTYSGLNYSVIFLVGVDPVTHALSVYPQLMSNGVPQYHAVGGMRTLVGGYVLGADGVTLLDPQPQPVQLSTIVSSIATQCGLSTGQIDVSQLIDIVDGFVVDQQTDGRNMLQPLRNAYFFDGVESSGVVKFPKRQTAAVVTIPQSDLAAFEGHSGNPPPLLQSDRVQEVDLPMRVDVKYLNVDADYQQGSQYSQRQVTHSQSVTSLDLPIVLSDLAAKQMADTNLTAAWVEREKCTFITSRAYAYLEPTDVVIVQGREVRIITREETSTKTIKFEALTTISQVYNAASVAIPASGFTPQPLPSPVSGTDLLLLDIPLVVDSDAPQVQGYYAALGPAGPGPWAAAGLFQSLDGGVSYPNQVLVTSSSDTIGVTAGTLGGFDARNNIFDEINSIVVTVRAGAAPAGASFAAVLNGANLCVIGSEILQFRNAVLVAYGQYQLSGLLRGRRGTEWAINTHAANEPFALLPVNRASMTLSQFFTSYYYDGVTAGQPLASGSIEQFTNTGAGYKPYAPCLLGGGSDASGNVTLDWVYRARVGGAWLPYVDVSPSEPYAFAVQIWDSTYTNCARVLGTALTGTSIVYLASQQTIDFGSLQKTIFFTVNQYGQLGPGYRGSGQASGTGASNTSVLSPVIPLSGT